MDHPMMAEQARLEAEMASLGVEKYRNQMADARAAERGSDWGSDRKALDSLLGPVTKAVKGFIETDRGKGRPPVAASRMASLGPELCAFIAVKVILDRLAKTRRLTAIATKIGTYIEMEARVAKFAADRPDYAHVMDKDMSSESGHATRRMAVFGRALALNGDDWEEWGARNRLLVGIKLIECVAESTGLLEVAYERRGRKTDAVLNTTQRFRDWLSSLDARLEMLSPEFMPCVVPPKAWEGTSEGGYYTDAFAFPPKLVKTRNKEHRRELEKADLSVVLKAVNAIQGTPWRIEKRVLAVAQALMEMGSERAGLPSMVDEQLPTRPADIDVNPEALKGWKREAYKTHTRNAQSFSKRLLALRTLHLAEKFSQYPAIWFPYQLDFRGRIYTIPQTMSPQGADLAKGLLVFAEGQPLDSGKAVDWFYVHGANSYGIDKVDFLERQQWIEENIGRIRDCAESPLDCLWWTEADSPFVFLAWCFEYADWLEQGDDFVSHIPIAMDGSCNGLQHYSAMLRDPVAGRAVNLVPSGVPEDIYGEVAKVAAARLQQEASGPPRQTEEEEERSYWADRWLNFGIDRKITKRPVMVLPYGGTQNSCTSYVREAVTEKLGEGKPNPFTEEEFAKAIGYLSATVWQSIGDVVVSARLAMGFLQQCARVVTTAGQPIKWTTPTGFPVVQRYQETVTKQINTRIFGRRLAPEIVEDVEDSLDGRRQTNGIAPNFVHSLDASALILTVNRAVDAGVTRFAMIHDSYGTTAGDTEALAGVLREAFVDMYEDHSVLEDFIQEVGKGLPEKLQKKLPNAPTVGGLDLRDVLRSPYFFA